MRSKVKADNTAMRDDEPGIHRAAVQLEPGDVWYDTGAPSIYILLSTSPWTFLVIHGTSEYRRCTGPILWSPVMLVNEGEDYIRSLFADIVLYTPGKDQ